MTLAAVLYAKDLDRLVEFYRTLGLVVDESQRGDYAVLTGPGVELSILQVPAAIAAQIEISDPPQARANMPIKLVFFVASIDSTLRAAQGRGGRSVDGAKRWRFRGHAVEDALDPEGNRFQLREPLDDTAPSG